MQYMILDSAGNALDSFDDELTAHATLHSMIRFEPDAADDVFLLAYDDDGMPVGEALSVFDVPAPVFVEPSPFLEPARLTTGLVRTRKLAQTRFYPFADVQPVRVA